MKEIILCKYGEIVLKGLNRGTFEAMLVKELQKRLKGCGNFKVYHEQSTAYIEPLDDDADLDLAMERAGTVFGFVSLSGPKGASCPTRNRRASGAYGRGRT